jgi:uncharacterized SAM-binding protein YcdF (DUF218 family)
MGVWRFIWHCLKRTALVTGLTFGMACLYVVWPRCQPTRPADAIVVLGSAVWPGERPSPSLARRITRGIELWQAGLAPILAPTGGVGYNPPAEAEVMARVAREAGVPDSALVLDTQATSTSESAEMVKALAVQHGWQRVILVSEPYHLRRASWLFREQGLEVETACAPWSAQRWSNVYQTLREAGGLLVMIVGLRTL